MLRRLREIDGVEVAEVAGAFYVLPNMHALCRRALAALDMQCPSVPDVQ